VAGHYKRVFSNVAWPYT